MIKIPEGKTEEEVIAAIYKIAYKVGSKYRVPNYDIEDIQQEAYMWCIDALEKYDGVHLETFLYKHIKNRVLNLIRKIERVESDTTNPKMLLSRQQKKSLQQPENIEEHTDSIYYIDKNVNINLGDLVQELNNLELRNIYLKYISGEKLSPCKVNKLKEAIVNLLKEKREL